MYRHGFSNTLFIFRAVHPQLMGLKKHSFPFDICSVAATVHFMVTKADIVRVTHLAVMRDDALHLNVACGGETWRRYPEALANLLRAMRRPKPGLRPTAQDCLVQKNGVAGIAKENKDVQIPLVQKNNVAYGGYNRSASGGHHAYREPCSEAKSCVQIYGLTC
jgi:hypothetical protein